MKQYFLMAMCSVALLGASCDDKKNDPAQPSQTESSTEVKTISYVNATARDKYVLFSFEKGAVVDTVALTDTSINTRTDWDLALHYYDFGTNSGPGRAGKGGAVVTEATDLTSSIAIPSADQFKVDEPISVVVGTGATHGAGYTYGTPLLNPVLTTIRVQKESTGAFPVYEYKNQGAIFLDLSGYGSGGGPVVKISPKVYLVRTATGKYARLQVTDSKDVKGEKSGYISFKYVYPVN